VVVEEIITLVNSNTRAYPSPFYNIATLSRGHRSQLHGCPLTSSGKGTFTKHIFANGEDIADVQGSTTTAKVYYIHDDALGGTNVISNASGTVAEVLDYYPFGGIRVNQQVTSTLDEQPPFG
jgi:hypothetical protein